MKQIKNNKNGFGKVLILLVFLILGFVVLGAVRDKQDTRSSAATYAKCSTKDLTGKILYGTCTSSGPTGFCSSTAFSGSGIVVKTSSCYCCVPDNGRVIGAEKCYAAGGACIRAYGIYQNYRDGSACTYGGQSGTFVSGLCLGTYGAIDYKCCKLNSTSKPSCASKGGACVGSLRTCTIGEGGTVVSGTSCSGSTPVCCRVTR